MEWIDKYKPTTLDNLITTAPNKAILKDILDNVPNTILYGHPGTGKSTFAQCLINKEDVTFFKKNASMETGIDFIRENVKKFATAHDLTNIKLVYFEEADRLSPEAQDSLKDLMESVKLITRFLFVTNHFNKITDALKSRCTIVCFDNPPMDEIKDYRKLILKENSLTIKNLDELIEDNYPDIRSIVKNLEIKSRGEQKMTENLPAKQNNEITDEKINEAVFKINEIFEKTIQKGMLEIGQYILKTFFDDNIELVTSQNPNKEVSFKKLTERTDLEVSQTGLLQAVKVAAQEKKLLAEENYKKLNYSQKVALLPLKEDDKKKDFIQKIEDEQLSVRQLKEKVRQLKIKSTKKPQLNYKIESQRFSNSVKKLVELSSVLISLNKKGKPDEKQFLKKDIELMIKKLTDLKKSFWYFADVSEVH